MMKHTKHLLVLWAALLLGAGNAWGVTETITGSVTGSTDGFTWAAAKESASNITLWSSSSSEFRFYYHSSGSGSSLTITPKSGITITEVTIDYKSGNGSYSVDGGAGVAFSADVIITSPITTSLKIWNSKTSNTQLKIASITVTYESGSTPTTVYLGLFLAAFVAVRACVRRVECLYATFHHIIMSRIDFRSVYFAKALFFLFSVHFFCLTKRNEPKKSQDCGGCVAKNLSFRCRLNRTRCARTAI
ncbi:MAG: hypothetical protein SO182_07065 [Paludibacteraceae bacterium]|nr:hypothetical protein [Paludibacteraceae bacterium]